MIRFRNITGMLCSQCCVLTSGGAWCHLVPRSLYAWVSFYAMEGVHPTFRSPEESEIGENHASCGKAQGELEKGTQGHGASIRSILRPSLRTAHVEVEDIDTGSLKTTHRHYRKTSHMPRGTCSTSVWRQKNISHGNLLNLLMLMCFILRHF